MLSVFMPPYSQNLLLNLLQEKSPWQNSKTGLRSAKELLQPITFKWWTLNRAGLWLTLLMRSSRDLRPDLTQHSFQAGYLDGKFCYELHALRESIFYKQKSHRLHIYAGSEQKWFNEVNEIKSICWFKTTTCEARSIKEIKYDSLKARD